MAIALQLNPLLIWLLVLFAAIVIIILVIAGFILLIRRFVTEQTDLNNRQYAVWKDTSQQLGLEFNSHYDGLHQAFDAEGEYQECKIKITFPVVQSSEDSSTIYTVCEAFFPSTLDILLEIKSEGIIKQTLDSVFKDNRVKFGLPDFENGFAVTCPNDEKARQLLTTDLPGEETQNLAADLLLIKKSVKYVKITNESVHLKNKGQLLETKEIKPLLDASVYLVRRIQAARAESAKGLDKNSRLFPKTRNV